MISEFEELPKTKTIDKYIVELAESKRKMKFFYALCWMLLVLMIISVILYFVELRYIGKI